MIKIPLKKLIIERKGKPFENDVNKEVRWCSIISKQKFAKYRFGGNHVEAIMNSYSADARDYYSYCSTPDEVDTDPLCCCEYFDRNEDRNHILACCCNCVDFDESCDRFVYLVSERKHWQRQLMAISIRLRMVWVIDTVASARSFGRKFADAYDFFFSMLYSQLRS